MRPSEGAFATQCNVDTNPRVTLMLAKCVSGNSGLYTAVDAESRAMIQRQLTNSVKLGGKLREATAREVYTSCKGVEKCMHQLEQPWVGAASHLTHICPCLFACVMHGVSDQCCLLNALEKTLVKLHQTSLGEGMHSLNNVMMILSLSRLGMQNLSADRYSFNDWARPLLLGQETSGCTVDPYTFDYLLIHTHTPEHHKRPMPLHPPLPALLSHCKFASKKKLQ